MTIKPSDEPIASSSHRRRPRGCDLCHQDVGSGSYESFRASFGLFALFMELFLAFFVFVAASIVQVCARSATAFVLLLLKKRTRKGRDLWFFSAEHVLVRYEQQWFISCGLLVHDKKPILLGVSFVSCEHQWFAPITTRTEHRLFHMNMERWCPWLNTEKY